MNALHNCFVRLCGICLLLVAGIPLQTGIAASRIVLMELMDATWCPYCPEAEEAMYNLAAQYGPSQIAAIEYHTTYGTDPFGTPETEARILWYNTPGFPTMFFDGDTSIVGGGVPMEPYYEPIRITHLAEPASMTITNTGFIYPGNGEVNTHIEIEWVEYTNVVLRFALIEHNLSYGNSDFHYICRDLLPEEDLLITAPGQTFDITRSFGVIPTWDAANLRVVTFVQYDGTKSVLQSSMGFTFPLADIAVTLTPSGTPIVIPDSGGSFDYNITVDNNESAVQTFYVWCDVTLPDGTSYGPVLGPFTITLDSAASIDRDRTQYVPEFAPTGIYSFNAYVGNYPDDFWSADSFAFEKSAANFGGNQVDDWRNTGQLFFTEPEPIPQYYRLYQNYPNPFNPETSIGFDLPEAVSVQLSVYNLAGCEVSRLIDGFRQAGHHEVAWNGASFAAGMYFYRLRAGKFSASGKMVLLK